MSETPSRRLRLALVSSLLLGQTYAGFFRLQCAAILHGRVDPVISPGAIAGHVHKISGGYNIGLNSTYDDMIDSKCTSCAITADKSAYWTPQLYYAYNNGTFAFVPSGGHLVYYLGRGDDIANVQPFPPGLRMVSGNNFARTLDTTTMTYMNSRPVSDRVSFVCLDGANSKYPQTPNMINTSCKDGMRAQIQFQSCWDGVNLYKTDNSHMAYLSRIDNGVCPPTHPVLLPHLFFEVYYRVNDVDKTGGGKFVFSNGDDTGYGFHGDFLNGWDQKVLQDGINGCIIGDNPSGEVSQCKPLAAYQSSNYGSSCPERPALINEQVKGLLTSLPGCNPVSGASDQSNNKRACGDAPSVNNFTPSTADQAAQMPALGSTSDGWKYVGLVNEPSNGRALTGASQSGPTTTVDGCQDFCAGKGFTLAGVEYGRECYCDNDLKNGASFTNTPGSVLNSTPCAGNSSQLCGGGKKLLVYSRMKIDRS